MSTRRARQNENSNQANVQPAADVHTTTSTGSQPELAAAESDEKAATANAGRIKDKDPGGRHARDCAARGSEAPDTYAPALSERTGPLTIPTCAVPCSLTVTVPHILAHRSG